MMAKWQRVYQMKDIISIIVPVYNVEVYLKQCLDSIQGQDYQYLEIILIDDGSSDNSGIICDQYKANDTRVKVIHQNNMGAAAAKNAGLRMATGKYISFVDSDDYLEPGAYSHMVKVLTENSADVVQCSYREIYRGNQIEQYITENSCEYTATEYLKTYTENWKSGLLWDKLYVRSIFDNIWFEEGHKIDDEYFTYRGIMNASKIIRDKKVVYNYRKRKSGVMLSDTSKNMILLDRIDYLSKRRINVINRFPELKDAFNEHFVEMMVILTNDNSSSKYSRDIIKKQLLLYLKEKNHTKIKWQLWPAIIRLFSGLYKKKDMSSEIEKMDLYKYFE